MGVQNRPLVITLLLAMVIVHSGKALKCYMCTSMNKNCETNPDDVYLMDCSKLTPETTTSTTTEPTTTEPTTTEPTTTEPTTTEPTTTEPTTTEPTTTEPTTTEPTTTEPTTTEPTTTEPTTTEPTTTEPTTTTEKEDPDEENPDGDKSGKNTEDNKSSDNTVNVEFVKRPRRSILPRFQFETYADPWKCASFKTKLGEETIAVRSCVPEDFKCIEPLEDCKICEEDKCNNANAISINMVTLGWLMLSWAAAYMLTDSY